LAAASSLMISTIFFLLFFTLSLCIFVVKCTNVLLFVIFSIRPKPCFGGVIEQSGYLVFFLARFATIKYYPIKNIFKFLQGLVGFGNLRFAEIKSCPSTYPTCDLRKAEIPHSLWKKIKVWKRDDPPAPFAKLFRKIEFFLMMASLRPKLTFVSFFLCFFLHLPHTSCRKSWWKHMSAEWEFENSCAQLQGCNRCRC